MSEKDWVAALENLNSVIALYEETFYGAKGIWTTANFPLQLYLWPLRERYESGERTDELYKKMINVK